MGMRNLFQIPVGFHETNLSYLVLNNSYSFKSLWVFMKQSEACSLYTASWFQIPVGFHETLYAEHTIEPQPVSNPCGFS